MSIVHTACNVQKQAQLPALQAKQPIADEWHGGVTLTKFEATLTKCTYRWWPP